MSHRDYNRSLISKHKTFVLTSIAILFTILAIQNITTLSEYNFESINQNLIIPAFADHTNLVVVLSSGTQTINYRNISPVENATATISMPATLTDTTVIVTVNDFDANVDTNNMDVVLSSATSTTSGASSASITMTETGVDTGTFTGNLILSSSTTTSGNTLEANNGDSIQLFYEEEAPAASLAGSFIEVPRLTATLGGIAGAGTVTVSDFIIDTNSKSNTVCPVKVVIHPAIISISVTTASSISITMSYANADLGTTSENNLKVFWRPGSGIGFINNFGLGLGGTVDTTAKTVTNTIQPTDPSIGGTINGQYVLGVNVGCSGGGGGGLVSPGLVVNALAGIGGIGGGGGAGPPGPTITLGALALYDSASEIISLPQQIRDIALNHDPYTPLEPIADIYEDFDLPFSINGNGFVLGGYENTLQTQTIKPGEPTEFQIVYYTNSEIAHTSLYFNLGLTRTIAGSDTQVLLYKDKPIEIVDPNGNIVSATGSINNEGELKRVATFLVTFSESAELPNHDIVIRSWTDNLSSGDTIIYDAIEVKSTEIVEIADEDIPEPEIQTLRSQYVPIWIKNNAAWWSQELIEDSDFVAGIEYLIQQEIITLTETGTLETNSSDEIPSWIKSNAGWWSEDLISEKEFIDGVQWLINIGVIKVVET